MEVDPTLLVRVHLAKDLIDPRVLGRGRLGLLGCGRPASSAAASSGAAPRPRPRHPPRPHRGAPRPRHPPRPRPPRPRPRHPRPRPRAPRPPRPRAPRLLPARPPGLLRGLLGRGLLGLVLVILLDRGRLLVSRALDLATPCQAWPSGRRGASVGSSCASLGCRRSIANASASASQSLGPRCAIALSWDASSGKKKRAP